MIDKLKSFEDNKHVDIQKELLQELLKFRETFLEEIKALEDKEKSEPQDSSVTKLEYRIEHLKKSYADLYNKYSIDVEKLTKENEMLRDQLKRDQVNSK